MELSNSNIEAVNRFVDLYRKIKGLAIDIGSLQLVALEQTMRGIVINLIEELINDS